MPIIKRGQLTGLVSIHDVMPDTLPRVRQLLARLQELGVDKITLLVVPGKNWSDDNLQTLRDWQQAGIHLAGHGWSHQAGKPRSIYHRLHSLLLSRLAAEHLSLQREQIAQLIRDCFQWFRENNLATPSLYVPPAWALGSLPRNQLAELPFRQVELLSGVIASGNNRMRRLPLTGYEADTAWRAFSLGKWNQWNLRRARSSGKPLRIGIHPFDEEYRLRDQMYGQVQACEQFINYDELFTASDQTA